MRDTAVLSETNNNDGEQQQGHFFIVLQEGAKHSEKTRILEGIFGMMIIILILIYLIICTFIACPSYSGLSKVYQA